MKNNKPFWELGLNGHTMLPPQKVVNISTVGIKNVNQEPRRIYYKG